MSNFASSGFCTINLQCGALNDLVNNQRIAKLMKRTELLREIKGQPKPTTAFTWAGSPPPATLPSNHKVLALTQHDAQYLTVRGGNEGSKL
jgi:hypothetical protein